MSAKIEEVKVVVDYSKIDKKIDNIYAEIDEKINELESRIGTLRDKEKLLDKFIYKNQAQLEATDSKNYKLRSQLQVAISKQLEIQQLVIDTIIKYEKLVQDYINQKQKLQNDKLNNYLKWKKSTETAADENRFLEVLKKFEEAVSVIEDNSNDDSENRDPAAKNELVKSILEQTFKEGYEI